MAPPPARTALTPTPLPLQEKGARTTERCPPLPSLQAAFPDGVEENLVRGSEEPSLPRVTPSARWSTRIHRAGPSATRPPSAARSSTTRVAVPAAGGRRGRGLEGRG